MITLRFLLLVFTISVRHVVQGFSAGISLPTAVRRRKNDDPSPVRLQVLAEPSVGVVVATLAVVGSGGAAVLWLSGSDHRAKKAQYAEWAKMEKARLEARRKLALLSPRAEPWTEEELKRYDGKIDPDGPILIAVAGKVYNVWKGRNFYGPGGEYSCFAGRDATRLLAKFRTEEEDEESLAKPLTMAERATLEGYIWTFKEKYEVVGTLAGYDPKETSMW